MLIEHVSIENRVLTSYVYYDYLYWFSFQNLISFILYSTHAHHDLTPSHELLLTRKTSSSVCNICIFSSSSCILCCICSSDLICFCCICCICCCISCICCCISLRSFSSGGKSSSVSLKQSSGARPTDSNNSNADRNELY